MSNFHTYAIPKGEHKCNASLLKRMLPVLSNKVECYAVFDHTVINDFEGVDRFDISKLFGIQEGISGENSARIGWRWLAGEGLQLFPYVHCNGDNLGAEDPAPICTVAFTGETEIYCRIEIRLTYYLFTIRQYRLTNGNSIKISEHTAKVKRGKGSPLRFRMWPYFGGSRTAPHDINIKMKIL